MAEELEVSGVDVALDELVPLHQRKVNFRTHAGYRKILASVREIGLIEPLCVYKDNGAYVILDGFVRFKACQELGVETIPCLMYANKEAYTFNRMVNQLSPTQQVRMLRKCLDTIEETTIARVLGMKKLTAKVSDATIKQLHPEVVKAMDKNLITLMSVHELILVKPERQLEILAEMNRCKDYGISFVRALVLRTPPKLRNRNRKRLSPWDKNAAQKKQLVAKLEAVEQRYDFYSGLYRQYTTDLLRLCIYTRKLISNDRVRAFLEEKEPDILERFQTILFETQGKAAGEPEAVVLDQTAASPATAE